MAKLEIQRQIGKVSASECYQVCLSSLDQIGYVLFKQRDIANLLICNETITGEKIGLTLMVPLGGPTRIQLTLSCDSMDQEALNSEANRILDIIHSNINQ